MDDIEDNTDYDMSSSMDIVEIMTRIWILTDNMNNVNNYSISLSEEQLKQMALEIFFDPSTVDEDNDKQHNFSLTVLSKLCELNYFKISCQFNNAKQIV